MRKWALWVSVFASILGQAMSLLSLSQHLRIQREGLVRESYCVVSKTINCDIVNASSYSEFLGVPIAWWGFLFYLVIFLFSLFAIFSKKKRYASVAISWFMSVGSIFYSLFLAYIAFYVLAVVCVECIAMYVANILLFIFLFVALNMSITKIPGLVMGYIKSFFGKDSGLKFKTSIWSHIVFIAIIFAAGMAVIFSVRKGYSRGESSLSVGEMLKYYNSQSEHMITVDPNWAVWGNPNAKVTIVEFSEYQCPFCMMSAFNVKPYLQEFKDDVRYYFVHYPLDKNCNEHLARQMHPEACMSSRAAICANKRNDFWSFHDDLFRNQRKINEKFVLKLAKKRGWDVDKFKACMDSEETLKELKSELAAGNSIYVSGTPTILIDGKKMRYWKYPEFVRAVVKQEIKKNKQLSKDKK